MRSRSTAISSIGFAGLASLLVVWLLLPQSALGQTTTHSNLLGAITDPQGLPVAGTQVTVTETSKGYSSSATTNAEGFYRIKGLLPGTYRMKAELDGFQTFVNENVIVYTRQERRVDIQLTVGEITEVVYVEAHGSVIETETPTISTNQSELEVRQFPPTGRGTSPMYTALSTPGFHRSNGTAHGGTASDWKSEHDGNNADNRGEFRPSEEMLQEVRIFSHNAPAEFQSSATVQATTKGGSNEWHGLARVLVANSALNALGPNSDGKRGVGRPTVQQDYSGGGPILRDKTFFFLSHTRRNNRSSRFATGYVYPQPQMRPGPGGADLGIVKVPEIIDPLTGLPFPNKVIPADRIDPTSKFMVDSYFPLPNRGGPDSLNDNWGFTNRSDTDYRNWNFRLDHQLLEDNQIAFIYSTINSDSSGLCSGDPGPPVGTCHDHVSRLKGGTNLDLYTIQNTHTFSPSIINEFTFGSNHTGYAGRNGTIEGTEALNLVGINNLGGRTPPPGIGFPTVKIVGISGLAGRIGSRESQQFWQHTIRDGVSVSRGNHLVKTGVQIRHNRPSALSQGPGTWGIYNFDGSITGDAYADFLLGFPNTTSIQTPRPVRKDRWNEIGLYLQDDWKVTPKLTLNLGVRNQVFTVPTDASGGFYNFDFETGNVVVPDIGSFRSISPDYPIPVVTADEAGYPKDLATGYHLWLEPRIGLAYRWRPNVVVRSGYGIYQVQPPLFGNLLGIRGRGPFGFNEEFGPNRVINGVPQLSFRHPFAAAPGAQPLQSVGFEELQRQRPYLQQWNLTLERQLPHQMGLSVTYLGTKGTNLVYQRNINKPEASSQPFQRRNPAFNEIRHIDYGGNSIYHSTVVTLNRQFSRGLYFRASFVHAKFLGDSAPDANWRDHGAVIEDPYNRSGYRGIGHIAGGSQAFEPTSLKLVAIWTLPFGEGERYLNQSKLYDLVLGGWTASTYIYASRGGRFTPVFSGSDPSNTGTSYGRASRINGCNHGHRRDEFYFWNEGCFTLPAPGQYGNVEQGVLRGPAWLMPRVSIFKDFRLGEYGGDFRPRLRLEAEIQAPFNSPTQARANTNISRPDFGFARKGTTDGLTTGYRRIKLNMALEF